MRSSEIPQFRLGLPSRLWVLLFVLAAENTVAVAIPHPWFSMYLYRGLPIVFGLALLFFGRLQFRATFLETSPLRTVPASFHVATLLLIAALEALLVLHFGAVPADLSFRITVWVWLALFPLLALTLILSFVPARRLLLLARSLGTAWVYAAVASALVVVLRERFRVAWGTSTSRLGLAAQAAAFHQATWLLRHAYPVLVQDEATHLLGTNRFQVIVGGTCSGLEGLALMSAFSAVWLIYARRELRLVRSLLLIPLALAMMWVLNIVRLVTLIAIGDAGHPEIATQGFHSEAGWIAFNVVSLAFLFTAQRIHFFRKPELIEGVSPSGPRQLTSGAANIPAIYLGPFLMITAVSVVNQAASAGFEYLYPLRLVAAAGVIWLFRREYRKLNWRFGAPGIAAGLAVAAMWLGLHHLLQASHAQMAADTGTAAALEAMSPLARVTWISSRVLAACLTVPIAEELAFRGFFARRLMSDQPQSVSFSHLTLTAIAGSSIAFGLVHGQMWLAGIFAGVAFAGVAKLRNRFGEAVAAHAVANMAIAIVALVRHDYGLW